MQFNSKVNKDLATMNWQMNKLKNAQIASRQKFDTRNAFQSNDSGIQIQPALKKPRSTKHQSSLRVNVPQRNMRRAMRLNSDTETYKKEFEVVKHTLKMRGVEEEIADLEQKLRFK